MDSSGRSGRGFDQIVIHIVGENLYPLTGRKLFDDLPRVVLVAQVGVAVCIAHDTPIDERTDRRLPLGKQHYLLFRHITPNALQPSCTHSISVFIAFVPLLDGFGALGQIVFVVSHLEDGEQLVILQGIEYDAALLRIEAQAGRVQGSGRYEVPRFASCPPCPYGPVAAAAYNRSSRISRTRIYVRGGNRARRRPSGKHS